MKRSKASDETKKRNLGDDSVLNRGLQRRAIFTRTSQKTSNKDMKEVSEQDSSCYTIKSESENAADLRAHLPHCIFYSKPTPSQQEAESSFMRRKKLSGSPKKSGLGKNLDQVSIGEDKDNGKDKKDKISNSSGKTLGACEDNKKSKKNAKGCGCPILPSMDDLRNYAYEGEGSSPGSLSSCCSGKINAPFLLIHYLHYYNKFQSSTIL